MPQLPKYVSQQDLNGIDPKLLTAAPDQLYTLPPTVVNGVQHAFSHAVDVAFLVDGAAHRRGLRAHLAAPRAAPAGDGARRLRASRLDVGGRTADLT